MGKKKNRKRKKLSKKIEMNRFTHPITKPRLPKNLTDKPEIPDKGENDSVTASHKDANGNSGYQADSPVMMTSQATGGEYDSVTASHKDANGNTGSDSQADSPVMVTSQATGGEFTISGSHDLNPSVFPEASNSSEVGGVSSKWRIPEHVENNIKWLLQQNPEGIYLEKISSMYLREFDTNLLPSDFGFADVIELVKSLSCCIMKWDETFRQILLLPKTGMVS